MKFQRDFFLVDMKVVPIPTNSAKFSFVYVVSNRSEIAQEKHPSPAGIVSKSA